VRGEVFGRDRAVAVAEIYATTPHGVAPYAAYFLLCTALIAVYAHHLRRSNHGRLLRVQVVNLVTLVVVVVVTKIVLLTTSMSVLAVPVAITAIVPTLVFDRIVGLATGVLTAVIVSLLVPFDVGVATVLVAQAAAAGLLMPEASRHPLRGTVLAGLASAGIAAFIYGVFTYLSTGVLPLAELATPGASAWVAAVIGGVVAAALSMPLLPMYQLLVGEITTGRLTQLQDLSHPLLRQIAEKSPGTWQHSLAMANMAEIAANAIGASGRLVRVGAYYHDLGKSLQAKYFIENIEPGEVSPHEQLPPEVSCDAIFAHVTEGIVAARRARLHERVIDFMHMHHGSGVLEYFWAKCQRQGNPKNLTIDAFRYPGVPPQSRETAILAICDAVEAAARTLKQPDPASIDQLVQRIVYGKLHLGQLDESGLSMADLRRISDSLRETIRHAHHGRIEYPWQQEGEKEGERTHSAARFEPRLDSLDAPRPPWHNKPTTSDGRARSQADSVALATTAMGQPTPSRMTMSPVVDRPVTTARALSASSEILEIIEPAAVADSHLAASLIPPTADDDVAARGPQATRRGHGPPPAPGGRAAAHLAGDDPATGRPSDPAITTPHVAQHGYPGASIAGEDADLSYPDLEIIGRPLPPVSEAARTLPGVPLSESSLARRIDTSLAAMEDPDPEDSPFAPHHPSTAADVMTSAPRGGFELNAAVTSPATPSYPDDADVTRQQPRAEIEELIASSAPSQPTIRRPRVTHEIGPDDIEAAIEVAPPARRLASVVQRLPSVPDKPSKPRK
jgi:cyclic-di-AMP phosphodiesterase PgpH